MQIVFEVEGIPKGQPRPRAFARNGKARVYDPGTAEAWKAAIALAAKPHKPATPLEGPVYVKIANRMPRPKAHFGTGKKANTLKGTAPFHHVSKPDLDNLAKAALDALTELGFWRDDAQICGLIATKIYDDRVGATIRIERDEPSEY